MTELPIESAIPRFRQNESRVHQFVNGGPTETYQTTDGTQVPTIRKFVADINTQGQGWLAIAQNAVSVAGDAAIAANIALTEAQGAASSAAADSSAASAARVLAQTSATNAATSATTAATQAGIATTQAQVATAQAGLAGASATSSAASFQESLNASTAAQAAAAQAVALQSAVQLRSLTGNRTAQLIDAGHLLTFSGAATLTIPAQSSVAWPAGTVIAAVQLEAATLTVSPAGGVTIVAAGPTIFAQGLVVTLIRVAQNQWLAIGDFGA